VKLSPGALLLVLAATAGLAAGCGGAKPPVSKEAVSAAVRRELKKAQKDGGVTMTTKALGNSFTVEDENGKRLLEAKVEKVEGMLQPGGKLGQAVQLSVVKARLFEKGKPQMDLTTPFATWDGKLLKTERTAHAVTTDGKSVIDAQKATWTADSGLLALEEATMNGLKNGKPDFIAQAPRADVLEKVITMPNGGVGRNPQGQQLTANRMRWHMETGVLEANGNVRVQDNDTVVTGNRLVSNTTLKRGKMTGGTQVVMRREPTLARKK
jgi:hypothetical protein